MHKAGFIKKTAKMRHKAVLDPTRYFYNFLYSRLVFVNHMLELFPLHRYISTINAFRSRTLHIMYNHPSTCIIFILVFVNHMLELFPLHRYISTINAFRSRTLHIMYKHPPTCIIFRYTQHVHLSKIRILRHTS